MKIVSSKWLSDTVFDALQGVWQFDRNIPNQAFMSGEARFDLRDDGRLQYRESGLLVLSNGHNCQAYRSYLYSRLPDGFGVWFDEPVPRPFHEVHLGIDGGGLSGRATHPCAADRYDTFYRFEHDGTFTVRHDVTGPRKGYTSTTVYRRG